MLYLGCGTGRLALPLSRVADEVVAVDDDEAMLEVLRDRTPPELAPRLRIVHADAAALRLDETFGLVALPSSLLNGILDDERRAGVLAAAARHCRDDGEAVLQVLNPYWLARLDAPEAGVIEPRGGGAPIEVRIEPGELEAWEQRRRARLTYRFPDGAVLHDDLDALALTPRELRRSLDRAGLRIVERWGAVPGRQALDVASPTWHLVCSPEHR